MKPWEMMRRFGGVSAGGGGDVVLLLNGGPPAGSTSFVDESPYAATLTRYGDAVYSGGQSKFGATSIYCPASPNGGLLTPTADRYHVGAGDFCVEAWVYPIVISGQRGIFDTRTSSGGGNGFFIYILDGRIGYYDGASAHETAVAVVATGSWQFIKMFRENGVVTIEVDGVDVLSRGDALDYASRQAFIGAAYYYPAGVVPLGGYLAPLRYTVGESRSGEGVPPGPF